MENTIPTLTMRQLAIITGHVAQRDNEPLFEVYLSDSDRALFVQEQPTTKQVEESTLFDAEEVRILRSVLYPPVDATPRPQPKSVEEIKQHRQQITADAPKPVTPKDIPANQLKYKLSNLQVAKLKDLGFNIDQDFAGVTFKEKFVGGHRPQHQVVIAYQGDMSVVFTRRGKIVTGQFEV